MNSFHQTNPSSAILDKFLVEKYHWEGTGRQLDGGGSRRKEEQTFMVKCLFTYSLHTLIWWRGASSVSFCKHLVSLELAGLLSASVKWKIFFSVCAELEVFSFFLPGRTWSVEHLSTTTDVLLLKMMLEKSSKTYIRTEEFTTHKGPTQG